MTTSIPLALWIYLNSLSYLTVVGYIHLYIYPFLKRVSSLLENSFLKHILRILWVFSVSIVISSFLSPILLIGTSLLVNMAKVLPMLLIFLKTLCYLIDSLYFFIVCFHFINFSLEFDYVFLFFLCGHYISFPYSGLWIHHQIINLRALKLEHVST